MILIKKLIRYNDAVSDSPLTWPLSCGQNDKTFAIRVKMTYQFWNWFRAEGAKNLSDYNKANGTEMRLLQEKGLRNKEKENLCLFVRNKIKEMYKKEGKKPIVMRLKKEQLILGELGAYDPVILAKRLDLDMSEWKGMSMEYLMDERVLKEGKALAIGPINLPGLAEEENHEDAPKSRKRQMEEDTAKPFKTKKISD
ncbi:unnamed protein product [Heligmosomoides polygyrus]|uniref:DUF1376 domain-containing protein n=1 Tax=Heligmosomoides polygyrus TaxID=6339 RepID=A0A183GUH2_HELPZ|nr:unnamed protein product [Heligmosomoides polygyrus]